MSKRFLGLSERLHRMKSLQQRLEESELARQAARKETHEHQLGVIQGQKHRAALMRTEQTDGRAMGAWTAYLMAVEGQASSAKTAVEMTTLQVMDQRDRVHLAYQDTRRWEVIRDKMQRADIKDREQEEQKALDDAAIHVVTRQGREW